MARETGLVLSLFPGIGIFDMAFEEQGFCVVRGPDLLWGGDVHTFHPPQGRFDGIIGGPPCQAFSTLRHIAKAKNPDYAPENLIPEFERCVKEAQPSWFLMENVPEAPDPAVTGYAIESFLLNNRWVGGVQNRLRKFSWGVRGEKPVSLRAKIEVVAIEAFESAPAVCASGIRNPSAPKERNERLKHFAHKSAAYLKIALRLQGLPEDFLKDAPFTLKGKHKAVGNAVPLLVGRALAKAVRKSLAKREEK